MDTAAALQISSLLLLRQAQHLFLLFNHDLCNYLLSDARREQPDNPALHLMLPIRRDDTISASNLIQRRPCRVSRRRHSKRRILIRASRAPRCDEAIHHAQHLDRMALVLHLIAQRPVERLAPGLCAGIQGSVCDGGGFALGRDIDDEPRGVAREHRQQGARQLHREAHVDVDALVDVARRAGSKGIPVADDANVVDEDGERDVGRCSVDGAVEGCVAGVVKRGGLLPGVEDENPDVDLVFGFEVGFDAVEFGFVAAVDHEVEAFRGQLVGPSHAEAIGGSSHQRPGSCGGLVERVLLAIFGERRRAKVEVEKLGELQSCRCQQAVAERRRNTGDEGHA